MRAQRHFLKAILFALILFCGRTSYSQEKSAAAAAPLKKTVLGTYFEVRPQFEETINNSVNSLRKIIREARNDGKLVCYLSLPLSATGGGYRPINVEVSDYLKTKLEKSYGQDKFYVLAPGHVETELPSVGGDRPGGGEYMYMWTEVLAGETGKGSDFDLVYFASRSDFLDYFQLSEPNLVPKIEDWMITRAKTDTAFKTSILDNSAAKSAFINYYALKAGISFSNGAHDEWNIFVKINRQRLTQVNGGVSTQIPCFFEQRSVTPLELEREISPGYEKQPASGKKSLFPELIQPWVDPKDAY